jgi:pimeloyl-ACP methyl ester carboxylesterase
MLAVNVAARHPDRTAALLLIDPAVADFYAYGSGTVCAQFLATTRRSAWRALFGLQWTDVQAGADPVSKALAPVLATMAATDAQPKYFRTAHSAYESICRNPLQLAAGDGVLGDIPLTVLAPPEEDTSLEMLGEAFRGRIADDQVARLRAVLRDGRAQAARLSRRGELIRGPAGTTHQLPYEAPDFVLTRLRELQSRLRDK